MGTAAPAGAGESDPKLLVEEDFAGPTVADSRWVRIGGHAGDEEKPYRVCLTGQDYRVVDQGTISGCGQELANAKDGAVLAPQVSVSPEERNGFLLLTPAFSDQAGAIQYDVAVPSFAGIAVEFDYVAYGSMQFPYGQGDGFSFFISDGSTALDHAGAFGGSLGYANKTDVAGITNGYLGIGFDWYGNFALDTEGRGTGCETASPYAEERLGITLRGPGSGTSGYCWLETKPLSYSDLLTVLPPTDSRVNSDKQVTRDTLKNPDSRLVRNVKVTVSEDEHPTVTVWLDKSGTRQGYVQQFSYKMDHKLPETFKFGFAASTGYAASNILIGNVSVHTFIKANELMLANQVDPSSEKATYQVGDEIKYQFTVTNTGPDSVESVEVLTTPYIDSVHCPYDALAAGGQAYSSMTCTGTYTVDSDNLIEGDGTWLFTSAAQAKGLPKNSEEVLESNISSVSVPVALQEDTYTSRISAAPERVILDGASSSTVTVTIEDAASGQPLTGRAVSLTSTFGAIGPVTDNGDGTYTATLTSTAPGTAAVSYQVDGEAAAGTATVQFVGLDASSSIAASPAVISALGDTSTIIATLIGTDGQPITDDNIVISLPNGSAGTIGPTTNVGDGTYTATYTSSGISNEDYAVRPQVSLGTDTRSAEVAVAKISGAISATPQKIYANGHSTADVSVTLQNSANNRVNRSDLVVHSTAGTVTDASNRNEGLHTATLTSETTASTATLTFTVNGVSIPGSTTVEFVSAQAASLPTLGGIGDWIFILAGIGILIFGATVLGAHYQQTKARHKAS